MRCELKPGGKEGDLHCDIISKTKDVRTGTTARRAVYSVIAEDQERMFFVSPDGSTHLVWYMTRKRFAIAQADANTTNGMLLQKQCSGAAVPSI